MTTLLQYRQDVIDGIAAQVPAFKAVGSHHTAMGPEELMAHAKTSPSCWVVIQDWLKTEMLAGRSKLFLPVRMVAYIIAKDIPGQAGPPAVPALPRGDASIALAEAVHRTVVLSGASNVGAPWGNEDVKATQSAAAREMTTLKVHRQGVALWGVAWTQQVQLDPVVTEAELAPFDLAQLSWVLKPYLHPDPDVIDADDSVDLT